MGGLTGRSVEVRQSGGAAGGRQSPRVRVAPREAEGATALQARPFRLSPLASPAMPLPGSPRLGAGRASSGRSLADPKKGGAPRGPPAADSKLIS